MQSFRFVAMGLLSLWLWLYWGTPAVAVDNLEQQVLQIIRNHPEVIIESVQAYQQNQKQAQQQAQQAAIQKLKPNTLVGTSPTIGAQNSPNLLVEFSDFQCPFCAQAASDVQAFLQQNSDQFTFTYKHLPSRLFTSKHCLPLRPLGPLNNKDSFGPTMMPFLLARMNWGRHSTPRLPSSYS